MYHGFGKEMYMSITTAMSLLTKERDGEIHIILLIGKLLQSLSSSDSYTPNLQ